MVYNIEEYTTKPIWTIVSSLVLMTTALTHSLGKHSDSISTCATNERCSAVLLQNSVSLHSFAQCCSRELEHDLEFVVVAFRRCIVSVYTLRTHTHTRARAQRKWKRENVHFGVKITYTSPTWTQTWLCTANRKLRKMNENALSKWETVALVNSTAIRQHFLLQIIFASSNAWMTNESYEQHWSTHFISSFSSIVAFLV